MKLFYCNQCRNSLKLEHKISFREECSHCYSDLHTCLNCRFYDPSSYNECKESLAEKVTDKEKNNYCEYFTLNYQKKTSPEDPTDNLKKAESLFKKS